MISGFQTVLFELDFKSVVDKIHSPGADISELGSIIQECSRIISSFPNFNVKFIRRQANSAAHCLARVALSKSSLHIYHCVPDCISQLIINEMQWSCFCQKIIVDILYWNEQKHLEGKKKGGLRECQIMPCPILTIPA